MVAEIDLKFIDFCNIIKKKIKLIILITFISTLTSSIISFYVIKPTYQVEVSVIIGKPENYGYDKTQYNFSDVEMYQKMVKTYSLIIKSKEVAEKVNKKINNEISVSQIKSMITAEQQGGTQILQIKVKSNDPKQAMKVLNVVTDAFEEESKRIFPEIGIKTMNKSEIPTEPVEPNKKFNIAIALFLGLMVSVVLVFSLEFMDTTIKSQNDVEKYLELTVIGVINRNT